MKDSIMLTWISIIKLYKEFNNTNRNMELIISCTKVYYLVFSAMDWEPLSVLMLLLI